MSGQPWKSDKWFTSPWNFQEEVVRDISFADKIKLHDVTLRDGEQQAGVAFNRDQKVAIAEKLAELGVHRIEAGMPAVSKQDEEAIREIVKRDLGPEIFAFSRCMKEDVKRAADTGVKGIVVEIPSSEHIIQNAYRWPLEKAIDLSIEATQYAKELGLYTVFFPIDMSRSDMKWVLDLVERVANEGHMDALAVVDTLGGLNPHAIPYLIRKTKERIQKPIEAHFHDDFGIGAANTIMALASGAEVAHTTVTAMGERAGNSPYEEVALALLTMYGKDIGLKYEKMYEVSKFVREIAHLQIRLNRPIVGEMVFNIESGIIADWYKNCGNEAPLELSPYTTDLVGQKPTRVVLGKNSGMPSIEIWLDEIGLSGIDNDRKAEILARVKERALIKGWLLDEDEFKDIVHKVTGIDAE